METYLMIFITALLCMIPVGWVFKYFDGVFNTQADLIDKIISKLQENTAKITVVENNHKQSSLDDFILEEE
jgi:hypothetical protein